MDQRFTPALRLPVRRRGAIRRIAVVAALALLGGCHWPFGGDSSTETVASASCLPVALKPPVAATAGYRLYIDRSASMAGYVADHDAPLALADIIKLTADEGARRGLPVRYAAFGEKIAPLAGRAAADAFTAPAAYRCPGGRCDNQQSWIDDVLGEVASTGADQLSIVVTDLWLDNKAFKGSPEVALGTPLRTLLRAGKAIGLLGIDAPYAGPVYDVPGYGSYTGATRRPLFAVLIGTPDEVTAAYRLFNESHSPALSGANTRYALFTAAPVVEVVVPPLRPHGGGTQQAVAFDGAERTLALSLDAAQAAAQGGRIDGAFDVLAGRDELRPGLQWNGRLAVDTRWWVLDDGADLAHCRAGMWRTAPPGPSPWTSGAGPSAATFALTPDAAASLRIPAHYFVAGELSAEGLYPNPASRWVQDWSLDPADAKTFADTRPSRFKALSLAAITDLMDREIVAEDAQNNRRRPLQRFAFVLTLNR